jgi:CheY-specific phosphatase CheX
MPSRKHMNKAIAAVIKRTRRYLEEQAGISVIGKDIVIGNIDVLELRTVTTIVGTAGPVNLLIAFSFAPVLLDHFLDLVAAEIGLEPHERPQFLLETAAETVNFILGHATADLAEDDAGVTLTPPMVLTGGRNIHRPKKAVFYAVELSTEYGNLDIYFIGPSEMFDTRLNIVGEDENSCIP